jgi:hypothetical protein
MAVTLTGTDGLFTRLGKIWQVMKDIEAHQSGGAASLDTQIEDVLDEYSAADADMAAALSNYTRTAQSEAGNAINTLNQSAITTLIEMVNDDVPLPSKTTQDALEELLRQMIANSDSFNGGNPVIGGLTANANNTGNGTVLYSQSDREGNTLQHHRPETFLLQCEQDAQVTGTAGQEVFSVKGEASQSDIRLYDWPGGSGYSSSIRVSDPAQDARTNVGGNRLTNSAFETFTTTNQPDSWTIETGTVGSDILEEGTTVYRGSKALAFVGDGSTLVKISQSLANVRIEPDTVYFVSYRLSVDASTVAGALRFTIQDNTNTPLAGATITETLSSISSGGTFDQNWLPFYTPTALPAGLKFAVEYTTAQTATKKVYIDDLILFKAHQIAPNGPYFGIIPGSTPFVVTDEFTQVINNLYTGEVLKYMDRSFDLYNKTLLFPFSIVGAETVSDTVIS